MSFYDNLDELRSEYGRVEGLLEQSRAQNEAQHKRILDLETELAQARHNASTNAIDLTPVLEAIRSLPAPAPAPAPVDLTPILEAVKSIKVTVPPPPAASVDLGPVMTAVNEIKNLVNNLISTAAIMREDTNLFKQALRKFGVV